MSHWTYAGEARTTRPSRKFLRPNPGYATLRMTARGQQAIQRPLLNKPARILLTMGLLFICLAALNRAPGFHDELAAGIAGGWDKIRAACVRPEGAKRTVLKKSAAPAAFVPVALLADGAVFGLSVDGRLQRCGQEFLRQGLVVITGCPVQEVPESMGIALKTKVPMEMVQALLKSAISRELSEIAFTAPAEIVLFTRDAVKIRLRLGPQLDQDLMRLASVWADARSRQLDPAVIDLRFVPQVVVRPRSRR